MIIGLLWWKPKTQKFKNKFLANAIEFMLEKEASSFDSAAVKRKRGEI